MKNSSARLQLLRKAREYTNNIEDLKVIYYLYIRSLLEQSSVVWGSSISLENQKQLERIQKNAVRIILKKEYTTYKDCLQILQ